MDHVVNGFPDPPRCQHTYYKVFGVQLRPKDYLRVVPYLMPYVADKNCVHRVVVRVDAKPAFRPTQFPKSMEVLGDTSMAAQSLR